MSPSMDDTQSFPGVTVGNASQDRLNGLGNDLNAAANTYGAQAYNQHWNGLTKGIDPSDDAAVDKFAGQYGVKRGNITDLPANGVTPPPRAMSNGELLQAAKQKYQPKFNSDILSQDQQYKNILSGTDPSVTSRVNQRLGLQPFQTAPVSPAVPAGAPGATATASHPGQMLADGVRSQVPMAVQLGAIGSQGPQDGEIAKTPGEINTLITDTGAPRTGLQPFQAAPNPAAPRDGAIARTPAEMNALITRVGGRSQPVGAAGVGMSYPGSFAGNDGAGTSAAAMRSSGLANRTRDAANAAEFSGVEDSWKQLQADPAQYGQLQSQAGAALAKNFQGQIAGAPNSSPGMYKPGELDALKGRQKALAGGDYSSVTPEEVRAFAAPQLHSAVRNSPALQPYMNAADDAGTANREQVPVQAYQQNRTDNTRSDAALQVPGQVVAATQNGLLQREQLAGQNALDVENARSKGGVDKQKEANAGIARKALIDGAGGVVKAGIETVGKVFAGGQRGPAQQRGPDPLDQQFGKTLDLAEQSVTRAEEGLQKAKNSGSGTFNEKATAAAQAQLDQATKARDAVYLEYARRRRGRGDPASTVDRQTAGGQPAPGAQSMLPEGLQPHPNPNAKGIFIHPSGARYRQVPNGFQRIA